jgi:peptidoglycan hydrolase-like protein with peptidoglycan-binding domain
VLIAVAAVCLGTIAAAGLSAFASGREEGEGSTPDAATQPAATAPVERRDLIEVAELDGSVSHRDPWPLAVEPGGIVTWAPPEGTVVQPGEVVLRVDEQPVHLAEGDVPMYRELGPASPRLEGPDVAQLQRFLTAAGFDDEGRLEVDGVFGAATERALEDWQAAVGLPETGRIDRSRLVFVPDAIRVDETLRVGTELAELPVTEAQQTVTATAGSAQSGFVVEGADAEIVTDAGTVPGKVVAVEEVDDGAGGSSTVATIAPDGDLAEVGDTDEVTVVVRHEVAGDVLAVPARALLALAEGGWAVEVVGPGGTTALVGVELGAVVDGMAEITGEVAEGDEVAVPT